MLEKYLEECVKVCMSDYGIWNILGQNLSDNFLVLCDGLVASVYLQCSYLPDFQKVDSEFCVKSGWQLHVETRALRECRPLPRGPGLSKPTITTDISPSISHFCR